MKTLILMILMISAAGCATLGTVPRTREMNGSSLEATATDSARPNIAAPFQDQNIGPQIIIPVTGGIPIIGIPLGGNIYLPVTGGAPIIGLSTSP